MSVVPETRTSVDEDYCAREPIHVPGSIQPHGVLLAFTEPDLAIVSASASSASAWGLAPQDLVERTLRDVLDPSDVERVCTPQSGVTLSGLEAFPVRAGPEGQRTRWTALVHRHDGLGILELEPVRAREDGASTLLLISAAERRLQAATNLHEACQIAVDEVRRVTGFDRVKLYTFGADWSGEVIAESRVPEMPSYLGLHFPASDIPPQARALYASNPVRLIGDVMYKPSPLVPDRNPQTGRAIDLSFATLRSVSPIHLEYLRNMQVGASMSASIVRDRKLWGLIACHHRTALHVDSEQRQACALLSQLLAAHLDALARVERVRRIARVEALRVALLHATNDGHSLDEALARNANELLALVDAGAFALVRRDRVIEGGALPPVPFVKSLCTWLSKASSADHFAVDRLGGLRADAQAHATLASGLLAVPLSRIDGSYLLWFRPEQTQTVRWAGEPTKAVDAADPKQLHPRASFDTWMEQASGRSTSWSAQDIGAALQLREVVLDLLVREKDHLERQNIQLAVSARELETFIYVASHDIKEPLRQMELLASLVRTHVKADDGDEVAGYFDEFKVVANRLRALTDQLAEYARLGRAERTMGVVVLDEVVEEVLAQLRGPIAEAGVAVEVGPLPTVLGERAQIAQVFVNLVSNAVKYRSTRRSPRIVVAAEAVREDEDAVGTMRPFAWISVADNGIGFDPAYDERVFEAFWRLHSRDQYDGSGIGLAICQRIVARHGGRIEAHGVADTGATFRFSLPVASDRLTSSPNKGTA